MIKHIVMWTVKETADRSRKENIQILKDKLMVLPAVIKEIKDFEVGINSVKSAAAYDVVLISGFDSWDDLDIYRNHPEHIKVAEFIGSVRDSRAVVDYES